MDWRNNRYFACRLDSCIYSYQMAQLKKLPIRLRPVPLAHSGSFNHEFEDELNLRGYYHILVGCHMDIADQVLFSLNEIFAGNDGRYIEIHPKRKNVCSIILDGRKPAEQLRRQVSNEVKLSELSLKLAVIVVGDDPASKVYVRNKQRACKAVGIDSQIVRLPGTSTTRDVVDAVNLLSVDPTVTGILVQLPLPKHIDEERILAAIPNEKDVDHFGVSSIGHLWKGDRFISSFYQPCTPGGIMRLFRRYGIPLTGKHAVIVGRSNIVGKPMAALLLENDCTVTICHSKTKNLADITRQADILVVAIGKPKFVTEDMVKPGATVIDVGINRMTDGTLCGDVDFDNVKYKAGAITPVPGGVGPMTVAMLLYNVVMLAQ